MPCGADPTCLAGLLRTRLCKHLNTRFQPHGIGHRCALALPLQHQPVSGWTAAKFRGRRSATAHAERRMVAFDAILNIQDTNVPLPHMQGVADVEELFLPVQLEFV